eukprot:jgi/Psemu1/63601/estExt_Genemark1.C_300130
MGDRHLGIRDRTLVLRVLVPGLETRLRDKMKEAEEAADNDPDTKSALDKANGGGGNSNSNRNHNNHNNNNNNSNNKEILIDLEGVACEPTSDSSTLWNFHCDGATYPARLVNLPCPVEVHKTHDHAMYYKCCDIAQMLIVYEDSMALDEADAYTKTEGYPSYYHSGITPPLKRVVERRFAFRDHQPGIKFSRSEVSDVEKELHELMCKISKEGGKGRKLKIPSLANQNKVLQEVEEEVLVDYEPWMQDGITFDATDQIASLHPEIWLDPETIEEIQLKEREKLEEEERKRQKEREKKQKKKKRKEQKEAAAAAAAAAQPNKKKGIASTKNVAPVDDVEQAAMQALAPDRADDDLDLDNLGFDFGDGMDLGGDFGDDTTKP